MLSRLRGEWQRLKRAAPGQRFQAMYRARREQQRHRWERPLWILAGSVLVLLGPAAGLVPGPGGILVLLLGLAILARELGAAARLLDWCEPRLRRAWRWTKRQWRHMPSLARAAVMGAGVALIAGCGYLGFRWLR